MFAFIVTITALADFDHHNPLFDAIRATPNGDKVCHFAFFGVFAGLVHRALAFRAWKILGVNIPVGPLGVLVFASLEELSQRFFPSRTLDLGDWLADFSGITLFTWLAQRRRADQRSLR
jgi:polysaccharide biosynthesis protein VpsQ